MVEGASLFVGRQIGMAEMLARVKGGALRRKFCSISSRDRSALAFAGAVAVSALRV